MIDPPKSSLTGRIPWDCSPWTPQELVRCVGLGVAWCMVRAVSSVFSVVICGPFPQMTRTRFGAWRLCRGGLGHVPGCLLRKGGDVQGKEVSIASGRLASLPFEAGSFALPATELRFAGSALQEEGDFSRVTTPIKTHGMN